MPWEDYCDSICSVEIGDGVTSIGEGAFEGCENLTEVTIGAGVTRIGASAFMESALSSVFIPRAVEEIGFLAFCCLFYSGKDEIVPTIQQIVVDPQNAYFSSQDGVLYDKAQTTLIQYPGANPRTAFSISNTVTDIGYAAFYLSTHLQSITIPGTVSYIGEAAFYYCAGLQEITIPGSVASIGESTFSACSALQSVTICEGVEEIGSYAFSECTSLTTVMIADSVTRIGDSAFSYSALTGVFIPRSVQEIGENAFSCFIESEDDYLPTLQQIEVDPENNFFSSASGVLYDKEQTSLILYPNANPCTAFSIPDSVTTIFSRAFYYCGNLASVTIGSGIETISEYAFESCKSLKTVYFNASDCSSARWAFSDCSALQLSLIHI